MPEINYDCTEETAQQQDSCNDLVCVNAERIYDSCGAKDCLTDLQLLFTDESQKIVDSATSVKICRATVTTATVDVEPVTFHRGFYAVDMTFFFDVSVEVYTSVAAIPVTVNGLATYGKRVVLYGSESATKTFESGVINPVISPDYGPCSFSRILPKASVQISDPMALSAKLVSADSVPKIHYGAIPEQLRKRYGFDFSCNAVNSVLVTLGIFTITHLQRTVQIMVPSYDFCVPRKECAPKTDDPCEVFSKIEFPTESFFPPKVDDVRRDNPSFDCKCSQ